MNKLFSIVGIRHCIIYNNYNKVILIYNLVWLPFDNQLLTNTTCDEPKLLLIQMAILFLFDIDYFQIRYQHISKNMLSIDNIQQLHSLITSQFQIRYICLQTPRLCGYIIKESVNEVHIKWQRIKSRKSTEYTNKRKYISNKPVLQKFSFRYTLDLLRN